jgi:hypothetical protein
METGNFKNCQKVFLMEEISEKKIIFFIILAALFVRLIFAFAPFNWLLERGILPDDAFYYFKIAENIANGHGITFDGVAQTNGFHPLWLFVITPIFFFIHQKIMAIHAVLALNALIGALSVFILYKIFLQLQLSRKISLLGAALFAFLPTNYLSGAGTMNGLETSLNVFAILLFVLSYLRVFKSRNFIFFGFISGFLLLARTDNAILLLISWLFLIFLFIKNKEWLSIKKLLISGIPLIAVVSPWFIWSYLNFGDIVQISGKVIPFVVHQRLALGGWNLFDYFLRYLNNIIDSLIYLSGILIKSKQSLEFIIVALGAVVFSGATFLFFRKYNSEPKKIFKQRMFILSPLIATFFIFILVQTIRTVFFRSWYYFSIIPLLFLIVVVVLDFTMTAFNRRTSSFFLIGGFVYLGVVLFTLVRFVFFPLSGGETGKYNMIQKLNEAIPPNSVVGAWNAGIYGYFFEKGRLINLDGVVNNAIYSHIKNRNVEEYAQKNGINYLVDDDWTLQNKYWGSARPIDNLKIIINLTDPEDGIIVAGYLKK